MVAPIYCGMALRQTDIYAWFTQSFDTADLKDDKRLLDELNR